MQWNKKRLDFLQPCIRQAQNQEQTQELRLPEGMPEIGNVLCAWGQPIIRSKEWRNDCMVITGGVNATVLYAPEDGSEPQSTECWLPFQAKWSFPESKREGVMRTGCLLRSMDARLLSSRKLMVRASVGILAEAMVPETVSVYTPETEEKDVQLLENTYPVMLPKEAGEKLFLLDEEVQAPEDIQKLIAWDITPQIQEENVVGDKGVVKGSAGLHLVYRSNDGKIRSQFTQLPFAQYVDLDREYGKEARMKTMVAVSNLEPELSEGHLRVKCGLIAQYMVCDREYLDLAQDAYSPFRQVETQMELLQLPVLLDSTGRTLDVETAMDMDFSQLADICFRPDYPVQYREGEEIIIELPGAFQVLAYDAEGNLQSKTQDFSEKTQLPAAEGCNVCMDICAAGQPSARGTLLSGQIQLTMDTVCQQQLPMLTSVELGGEIQPDPQRPSLIVMRMPQESLWQLAKLCGSTVEAIRKANQLSAEPMPGQMLLIPVC